MPPLSRQFGKALVTGASRGLGLAFAQMLLSEGVEVWGTSRNPESLPTLPGFHPLALDLDDPASVQALMQEHQELLDQIDLLVNNAGLGVFSSFFETEPAAIATQLKVLWHGPIVLCHRVLPAMLHRNRGTIVNISSLAADFPLPWFTLYSSAKAGLSQFSRGLANELHGCPIRVIDFQAGDYQTGFNQAAQRPPSMDEEETQLWNRLEQCLASGPPPERAARDLRRALQRQRSGLVRSGGFLQTRLAPLAMRLLPWRGTAWLIRKYYRLP